MLKAARGCCLGTVAAIMRVAAAGRRHLCLVLEHADLPCRPGQLSSGQASGGASQGEWRCVGRYLPLGLQVGLALGQAKLAGRRHFLAELRPHKGQPAG